MAARKNAPTQATKPARKRARKHALKPAQVVSLILGGVSVCGLTLSLAHMSDAIHACWGASSHWWMAACMAATIDAGMLGCECGEMVAPKHSRGRGWMRAYMLSACVLSSMLNCKGALMHAPPDAWLLACILGCVLPWMLLALMRGCVHLWMD